MQATSILKEIKELIGLPATMELVKRYGGTNIWVPARFRPEWGVAVLIGREAALRLQRRLPNTSLYIPKMDEDLRGQRNQAIIRDYSSGVPVATLARSYNLSDRQIWNILGSP